MNLRGEEDIAGVKGRGHRRDWRRGKGMLVRVLIAVIKHHWVGKFFFT